jgi:hypothetical protein
MTSGKIERENKPLWEIILKYISNKVGKVLGVSTAWVCV